MPSSKRSASGPVWSGGWGGFRALAGDSALSYSKVDAEVLRRSIAAVTKDGDAIMLSVTSDGGAFCVATYSSGKRDSRYFTDVASLQEALEYLCRVL